MEMLERGDSFEEINGNLQYAHSLIAYRFDDNVFHAITNSRCRFTAKVKTEDLLNVVLIPTASYCPHFPSNFTQAPDLLPPNCYIKRPRLLSYVTKIHSLFTPNRKAPQNRRCCGLFLPDESSTTMPNRQRGLCLKLQ